ncbi:MAG: ABC transporter permease [Verrucomicrobiales bacterium]|nr:ABC transporter permease [Verrucomicrobiales bacterium]
MLKAFIWVTRIGSYRMKNDLKLALRQLLKNPGFTVVAVVTLALGIGANTALFSIINGMLLRPLPYPDSKRLVAVCESNPRLGWDQYAASLGAFSDWRKHCASFQELAGGMVLGPTPLVGASGSEMVHVASVSAGFFHLLGVQPLLGRPFLPEEETPGGGDVVVLSEDLWRNRFGADPDVVNRSVRLGDRSFSVVGVMPARLKVFDPSGVHGWDGGFSRSDVWRPLPVNSGLAKQRSYRTLLVLGRLKPGVTLARAQAEMSAFAQDQGRQFPESNAEWGVSVQPFDQLVVREVRRPLLLLFGAVGMVLLIATANLANVSLARAVARQREMTVRMALGAGRLRVAKQLLTESLALSCLGSLIGLLLANWSLSLLAKLAPQDLPRTEEIALDGRVLGFTLFVSVLVGLLLGLAPILTFWRKDLNQGLKLEGRGSSDGTGKHRMRTSLVVVQMALLTVLLSGAGLLLRSFWRLSAVDPGFRPDQAVAVDVSLNGPRYTNAQNRIAGVQALLSGLAERPVTDTFAAVDGLPLDGGRGNMDIALTSMEGSPSGEPEEKRIAGLRLVSPGYFRTMQIPLSQGRFFTDRDNTGGLPVVIINESLARRYFQGINPLGKRIGSPDFGPKLCEVVGVVKDVRHQSLDASPQPEAFRPLLQECFSGITVVARTKASAAQVTARVRDAASLVDRDWPVHNSRRLEHLVSESMASRRFALLLTELFAGLALLMALVGIYGVLSCITAERTREIGIRLAVGAQRSDILWSVLGRGMRSVAMGGAIGLGAAIGSAKFLGSLLYEVSPTDPMTFAFVSLALGAAALCACWLPAWRGAQVDPLVALRNE